MALSEFRKAKLLHVFNTFFDVNRSGEIDETDLELAIKTVCAARGWQASSSRYATTETALKDIWGVLTSLADKDNDCKVTVDEWNSMWAEGAADRAWVATFRDLLFSLEDISGNASIDSGEYCRLYMCLGVPESQCKAAFAKLSGDQSEVSKEDFCKLWDQYFTSEDPEARGNFIFGRTSF